MCLRSFKNNPGAFLFLFSFVVFLGLYFPTFQIEPRGDDWLLLAPARKLVRDFGILGAAAGVFTVTFGDFWRPLAILPHLLSQENLFWAQVLKAIAFLGLAGLIVKTARELGISGQGAFFLGGVLLIHQGFVITTAEPDVWGNLICAIALLGLFVVGLRYSRGSLKGFQYILWTVTLTVVSLLSKEAGVVCFLTPLTLFFLLPREEAKNPTAGHLLAAAVAFGMVVAYLGVRLAIGVTISGTEQTGYYAFSVGKNIPFNVVLAVLALLSPINTLQVALGSPVWRLGAALWTVFLIALCIRGYLLIAGKGKWRLPVVLALLFFAGQGPVLLMPHITEANMTRSLSFGLLLVGHCLIPVIERFRRSAWRFVGVVFILWIGFDLAAVHMKINGILNQHQMAATFRQEVLRLMPEPPDHRLVFLAAAPEERGYSVFKQPLVVALQQGEIPIGLRELYRKESLEASLQIVSCMESKPVFKGRFDFYIDQDGHVLRSHMEPILH